ncbi:hypothetical protein AB1Y20_011448 [Prymnesium parvum]|uniref:Uncharacterized protein n=1 Tax=Prymnesium parvum TaxID=97485 RepID=A0AB34IMV1_PRYPA|mmetsp:Transcript_40933/g.101762  ORF Transcript_40933/g.101762 Transcript_40933/m.101762 type:complete len:126 (+) Transcript_40933:78-455(+)
MVYLRAGSVVQQPSYLDELLSLPMRIYQFLLFFFTTLIDVRNPSNHHYTSAMPPNTPPLHRLYTTIKPPHLSHYTPPLHYHYTVTPALHNYITTTPLLHCHYTTGPSPSVIEPHRTAITQPLHHQ